MIASMLELHKMLSILSLAGPQCLLLILLNVFLMYGTMYVFFVFENTPKTQKTRRQDANQGIHTCICLVHFFVLLL